MIRFFSWNSEWRREQYRFTYQKNYQHGIVCVKISTEKKNRNLYIREKKTNYKMIFDEEFFGTKKKK